MPPPNTDPGPRPMDPIKKTWGSVRVNLWCYLFLVRERYLGRLVAVIVAIISAVELSTTFVHDFVREVIVRHWLRGSIPDPTGLNDRINSILELSVFQVGVPLVLMAASLILFFSHRRLEAREGSHKRLLGYLKALAGEDWTRDAEPLERRLTELLDELVIVLDQQRRKRPNERSDKGDPLLNATIMELDLKSDPKAFRILAQSRWEPFSSDTHIPQAHSFASYVIDNEPTEENAGFLVYVPWTEFEHGISFEYFARPGEDWVSESRFIDTLFRKAKGAGQDRLGCLLCTRIHLDRNGYPPHVLSLSSKRAASFGSEVFDAARLVSSLLPQAFGAPTKDSS